MSFAEDVKNEIAHYETTDERVRRAELAALLCIGGQCASRFETTQKELLCLAFIADS